MNKSTLDLSRAAALAKQIKANGGKQPGEEALSTTATTAPPPGTGKRKLATSAQIDTAAIKAAVFKQINAIRHEARKNFAANIKNSGLLSDNSNAQEASIKIEQMVQDIIDLYVPLFERELRTTLEDDILEKLSQSTEL